MNEDKEFMEWLTANLPDWELEYADMVDLLYAAFVAGRSSRKEK